MCEIQEVRIRRFDIARRAGLLVLPGWRVRFCVSIDLFFVRVAPPPLGHALACGGSAVVRFCHVRLAMRRHLRSDRAHLGVGGAFRQFPPGHQPSLACPNVRMYMLAPQSPPKRGEYLEW